MAHGPLVLCLFGFFLPASLVQYRKHGDKYFSCGFLFLVQESVSQHSDAIQIENVFTKLYTIIPPHFCIVW